MTNIGKNKQRQRMMIFSFGLLMLLYVASHSSYLSTEWIGMKIEKQEHSFTSTDGYPDTQEDGILAARKDINAGKPKYMLYGLVNLDEAKSRANKNMEFRFGGCVLGDSGYRFWTGYNSEVIRQGLIKN